jgi:hypothetical protein
MAQQKPELVRYQSPVKQPLAAGADRKSACAATTQTRPSTADDVVYKRLTSGTPGKRSALPHASILLHQPHAGVGGTASDIVIQARQFERLKRRTAELTAAHTGQTVERIHRDSERDSWFTAHQALAYGFIDRVVDTGLSTPVVDTTGQLVPG